MRIFMCKCDAVWKNKILELELETSSLFYPCNFQRAVDQDPRPPVLVTLPIMHTQLTQAVPVGSLVFLVVRVPAERPVRIVSVVRVRTKLRCCLVINVSGFSGVLAPVPLIFRSNLKFDQNLQCSGLKCTQPITTKFCTCHDSVTSWRAKFGSDRLSLF